MKKAVVLFNLGGPRNQKEVYPFLKSLFADPSIIGAPWPFNQWLAALIAWRRHKTAQKIFEALGGKSPLLENTLHQAKALEDCLGDSYRVFVMMRHAPPFFDDVIEDIVDYSPEETILLPLYPQFSTTTTGSFLNMWFEKAKKYSIGRVRTICCYPVLEGFVGAIADLVQKQLPLSPPFPWVLFCAHGLPRRIIKKGDPYVFHVEQTMQQVMKVLRQDLAKKHPQHDSGKALQDAALQDTRLHGAICYQSKVGPLPWTTPSLDEALQQAAQNHKNVLVVPLSFVSEHSETLVELDDEAKEKADKMGVFFDRTPTVSTHPLFIQGLGSLVQSLHQECFCPHKTACWKTNPLFQHKEKTP